jgi:hypothetical protein
MWDYINKWKFLKGNRKAKTTNDNYKSYHKWPSVRISETIEQIANGGWGPESICCSKSLNKKMEKTLILKENPEKYKKFFSMLS